MNRKSIFINYHYFLFATELKKVLLIFNLHLIRKKMVVTPLIGFNYLNKLPNQFIRIKCLNGIVCESVVPIARKWPATPIANQFHAKHILNANRF